MPDHELRIDLNNEVHARSSSPIIPPARVSLLAYTITKGDPDPLDNIAALAKTFGQPLPPLKSFHHTIHFANTSVRFERHGEFYRLSIRTIGTKESRDAIEDIPPQWIASLPGKRLVAINTQILAKGSMNIERNLKVSGFKSHGTNWLT